MRQRLIYVVDVDSGDNENDREYLAKLQETFIAVTDLQNYGYTGDELFCRSTFGNKEDSPEMQVAGNIFGWDDGHDNDGQLIYYTGIYKEDHAS